jgi:site-specific recombinase XerD
LCDFLVKDDIIMGNPMAGVPKPKPARSAPHAFTEQDTARLLAVLREGNVPGRSPWPKRDYAIVATLVVSGLRAGELLALRMGDIEGREEERQIAVREGKGDKYRAVPLDPHLEPILTDYLIDRHQRLGMRDSQAFSTDPWTLSPALPLWVDDQGHALTIGKLEHLVRRAYKAAGINSHRPAGALIHALRHTFATRLVENGVSSVEVMNLLGHSDLQTTQRYVATRPDHLRSAVAANPALQQL